MSICVSSPAPPLDPRVRSSEPHLRAGGEERSSRLPIHEKGGRGTESLSSCTVIISARALAAHLTYSRLALCSPPRSRTSTLLLLSGSGTWGPAAAARQSRHVHLRRSQKTPTKQAGGGHSSRTRRRPGSPRLPLASQRTASRPRVAAARLPPTAYRGAWSLWAWGSVYSMGSAIMRRASCEACSLRSTLGSSTPGRRYTCRTWSRSCSCVRL